MRKNQPSKAESSIRQTFHAPADEFAVLTPPHTIGVKKLDNNIKLVHFAPGSRDVQRRILHYLQSVDEPTDYSLFRRSEAHKQLQRKQGFFDTLVLDLRNCFGYVLFSRVLGLLRSRGHPFPERYASHCVFEGSLARGSICSNYILELLLKRLDYRLAGLANRHRAFYRRYIDDLWFIGKPTINGVAELFYNAQLAIKQEGFAINTLKTRYEPLDMDRSFPENVLLDSGL